VDVDVDVEVELVGRRCAHQLMNLSYRA